MDKTNGIDYRQATAADIAALIQSRAADLEWGPADPRTGSYLEGLHHPGGALPPRVIYLASEGSSVVGYIGGHLTTRFECDGELQYLWVAPNERRGGVASGLLRSLAGWFTEHGAARICVDVLPDNQRARSFYSRYGAVELNPHWLVWDDIGRSVASVSPPNPS